MLVAIDLPDDLVVARGGLEIRDGRPDCPRGATLMDRIQMPIDSCAGRYLGTCRIEPQSGISQQVVLASENAVRPAGRLADAVWKRREDGVDEGPPQCGACHKSPRRVDQVPRQLAMGRLPVAAGERRARSLEARQPRESRRQVFAFPRRCADSRRDAVDRRTSVGLETPADLGRVHPRKTHQATPDHGPGVQEARAPDLFFR